MPFVFLLWTSKGKACLGKKWTGYLKPQISSNQDRVQGKFGDGQCVALMSTLIVGLQGPHQYPVTRVVSQCIHPQPSLWVDSMPIESGSLLKWDPKEPHQANRKGGSTIGRTWGTHIRYRETTSKTESTLIHFHSCRLQDLLSYFLRPLHGQLPGVSQIGLKEKAL